MCRQFLALTYVFGEAAAGPLYNARRLTGLAAAAAPAPCAMTPSSPGLVVQNLALPLRLRDFRLIAFDMDSTLINIECIDEIAAAAGFP